MVGTIYLELRVLESEYIGLTLSRHNPIIVEELPQTSQLKQNLVNKPSHGSS